VGFFFIVVVEVKLCGDGLVGGYIFRGEVFFVDEFFEFCEVEEGLFSDFAFSRVRSVCIFKLRMGVDSGFLRRILW